MDQLSFPVIAGATVLLGLILGFLMRRKPKMKRQMSFNSKNLLDGAFPEDKDVIKPIVNVALYFKELPSISELVKVMKRLRHLYRFRCTVSNGKLVEQSEMDVTGLYSNFICSNETEVMSKAEKICMEDTFDGSDGLALWRFVRLENKGKGSHCILFRAHHTLGDGLAFVGCINHLFTLEDGSKLELGIAENMRGGSLDTDTSAQQTLVTAIPNAIVWFFSILVKATAGLVHVLLLGMSAYDSKCILSITGSNITMAGTSGKRRVVYIPTIRLSYIKALKNAAKVTVNDVLMAATAGMIRRYCEVKKADMPTRMRALIPVAFPRPREELENPDTALRNKWAFVSAHLPVDACDPHGRLRAVNAEMKMVKDSGRVVMQSWVQENLLPLLPRFFARQTAYDIFSRHSMVFSNVPGPSDDIFFSGKRLCGMQVIFPNLINQALLISYKGAIFMNIVVDPSIVSNDDEKCLQDCFIQELLTLGKTLGLNHSKESILVDASSQNIVSTV
jgi:hypothetical protein